MTVKYEAQGRLHVALLHAALLHVALLHVALLHVAFFPSGTADYIA